MFSMILEDGFEELDESSLLAINGGACTGSSSSGSSYSGGCTGYSGGSSSTSYSGSCTATGTISGSTTTGSVSSGGCTVINNIIASINENDEKKYTDTYRCDDWVQEVLDDAGYNYNDYFAGDASGKTCEEHIAALEDSSYTTEAPTSNGVYVVLMNEGHSYTKPDGTTDNYAAHTGILVVGNGNPYFVDNSSSNSNGGVQVTTGGTTASSVMSKYGYDSFYYQKVQ